MISPVTKEISGFSVRFRPLPATKAFELALRVGAIVAPLLKSIDLANLKADVNLEKVLDTISTTLATLPGDVATALVVDSLKGCTITAPGVAPMEVNSSAEIDALFVGELDAMYEIVLESWKYNKLAPFKLAARFGLQMAKTDTSSEAASTPTKHGPKLAI